MVYKWPVDSIWNCCSCGSPTGSTLNTAPSNIRSRCSMAMANVLHVAILLALFSQRVAFAEASCTLSNNTEVMTCNVTNFPSNTPAKRLFVVDLDLEIFENISLPPNVKSFTLHRSKVKKVGKFMFNATFDSKLQILHLTDSTISEIDPGAFDNLVNLQVLNLKSNYLKAFPVFNRPNNHMKQLYLENNSIDKLKPDSLNNLPSLEKLDLKKNKFTIIPKKFLKETPEINDLDFSYSPVKVIEEDAFKGLDKLKKLNLDGTDIQELPSNGLENLLILSLRAKRLNSIPRNLERIERIDLSVDKSFLCCKFFFETLEPMHGPRTETYPTFAHTTPGTPPSNRDNGMVSTTASTYSDINKTTLIPVGFVKNENPIIVVTAGPFNASGGFVTVSNTKKMVECYPSPTDFQPCENIMGTDWLTAVSFVVALFALCGNFVVIVVLLCLARNYSVPRFLVTNLAIADMCMGVYLLSLVVESVMTAGEYYNHVTRFQYGFSCKVLGFLAVFSSELSIFSLTLITFERYLTIVYAMYPKRRMKMKNAVVLMGIGWFVSATIAILPILGVGSYSKVAICLPFEVEDGGKYYLLSVFCFNGISFLIITVLYIGIYRSVFISSNSTPTRSHDSRVASRMGLLVFTDFACFAPIAVFALFTIFGDSLIGVKESKFLLVFFFPLNSFVNPFLYVLMTKTFRRDFATLLKNCFVCGETFTGYLSSIAARSPQSHHDPVSQATRQSMDFNTVDSMQEGSGNLHHSKEIPYNASFSKSEPSLVRFNIRHSNVNPVASS